MKEVLKLALEALEPLIVERTCEAMDAGEKAITAIKEVLAQKCVCGEPNSSGTHRTDGPCLAPQQEQEPVAYIHRNEYNEYRLEPHDNFDIKSIPFNVDVSLFKSPQRTWVGLTDDEINDIVHNHDELNGSWELIDMVEAKLKEKNT